LFTSKNLVANEHDEVEEIKMDEILRTGDLSHATVGWTPWGTGTIGITKGETSRLCTVNVGSVPSIVFCGIFQNPPLVQDSFTLQPGESRCCDVSADGIPSELFDKAGRVQLRAFIQTNSRSVKANLEVFDNRTGRTSVVLPLLELTNKELKNTKEDDKEERYSAEALKRLWKLEYDKLAVAPGEPGARLREARFIMQARVAFETRRLGIIMAWATIVMAFATVILAVATIVIAMHGG